MPALNFTVFVDQVESDRKLTTIRAFRKDGRDPKPGQTLYLFTGMRTKKCRRLGESPCLSTTPIRIRKGRLHERHTIIVELRGPRGAWRRISRQDATAIARNDGFDSLFSFRRFFLDSPKVNYFEGLLIKRGALKR